MKRRFSPNGPRQRRSKKDGRLTVLKRTYRKNGQRISASFVNEVLIDFAITPQESANQPYVSGVKSGTVSGMSPWCLGTARVS